MRTRQTGRKPAAQYTSRRRMPKAPTGPLVVYDDVVGTLSGEFNIPKAKVEEYIRGCGLNLDQDPTGTQMSLYREILSCRLCRYEQYAAIGEEAELLLDEQLRGFDEVFVDTAPIIQEDWFLRFLANAVPVLKRRKKKLLILEKTMEELHGLKDNPEKDRDVRIRATIRPELIRALARKGLVRIPDTGSVGIADDHLVNVFTAQGQTKSMLLITQDRGLSERIVSVAATNDPIVAEKAPQAPVKQGFFARLLHRKPQEEPVAAQRRMMVCKFDETGALKRLYVCPDCGMSYYDRPILESNGLILCSQCVDKRQKAEVEAQRKAEALQARQERQAALEQKRKEQEALVVPAKTVADVIKDKRHKNNVILALVVVSVVVLGILLFFLFR